MTAAAAVVAIACTVVLAAAVLIMGHEVKRLRKHARRQDGEMTQLWTAHTALTRRVVQTELRRTRAEHLVDQVISGLAKKRDAPAGTRGVPNIEPNEGANP